MRLPLFVIMVAGFCIGSANFLERDEKNEQGQKMCFEPESLYIHYRLHQGDEYQEKFPVDTQLTYRCGVGYLPRDVKTWNATCRMKSDGTVYWEIDKYDCRPVSCGHPGDIRWGRLMDGVFVFPRHVRYQCNKGYRMVGDAELHCQTDGTWDKAKPECRIVDCGPLNGIDNGTVSVHGTEYGSKAEFTCNDGFKLRGASTRTCDADGEWSEESPHCEEIWCPQPEPPEVNGTTSLGVNPGRQRSGTRLQYFCPPNTALIGSEINVCRETGSWLFERPKCIPNCVVQPDISAAVMRQSSYRYNRKQELAPGTQVESSQSVLFVVCKEGYEFISWNFNLREMPLRCESGTWEPPGPWCTEKPCRNFYVQGAEPEYMDVWPNQGMNFTCKKKYTLHKKPDARAPICKWGRIYGDVPICKPDDCRFEDLHNRVEGGKPRQNQDISHGSIAVYDCGPALVLDGPGGLHCNLGSWIGEPPKCVPSKCTVPDHVGSKVLEQKWPSTLRSPQELAPGTQVESSQSVLFVVCKEGYEFISGNFNLREMPLRCESGTWEPPGPWCTEKPCRNFYVQGAEPEYMDVWPNQGMNFTCKQKYTLQKKPDARAPICKWGRIYGDVPICKPDDCRFEDLHNRVEGGKPRQNQDISHGSIAVYDCGPALVLDGPGGLHCNLGSWIGEPPKCVPSKECTVPDHVGSKVLEKKWPSTLRSPREVKPGTIVQDGSSGLFVNCEDGYRLRDERLRHSKQPTLFCINGTWYPPAPWCEKKCTVPDHVGSKVLEQKWPSTLRSPQELAPGTQVESSQSVLFVVCKEGYEFISGNFNLREMPLRCESGTWEPPGPWCTENDCRFEDLHNRVEGGKPRQHQDISHGSIAVYDCEPPLVLDGPGGLRCNLGSWIGEPPKCVPSSVPSATCQLPGRANRFKAHHNNIRILPLDRVANGSRLVFHCEPVGETILEGSRTSQCLNGLWTAEVPLCYGEESPKLMDIHMKFHTEIYTVPGGVVHVEPGSEVRVECWSREPIYCRVTGTNARVQNYRSPQGHYISIARFTVPRGQRTSIECGKVFNSAYNRRIAVVGRSLYKCPEIPPKQYRKVLRRNREVYEFSCLPGSRLQGKSTVYCLGHGVWGGTLPSCVPLNTTSGVRTTGRQDSSQVKRTTWKPVVPRPAPTPADTLRHAEGIRNRPNEPSNSGSFGEPTVHTASGDEEPLTNGGHGHNAMYAPAGPARASPESTASQPTADRQRPSGKISNDTRVEDHETSSSGESARDHVTGTSTEYASMPHQVSEKARPAVLSTSQNESSRSATCAHHTDSGLCSDPSNHGGATLIGRAVDPLTTVASVVHGVGAIGAERRREADFSDYTTNSSFSTRYPQQSTGLLPHGAKAKVPGSTTMETSLEGTQRPILNSSVSVQAAEAQDGCEMIRFFDLAPHGLIIVTKNTTAPLNSKFWASCDGDEYTLVGNSSAITCLQNGSWDIPPQLKCIEKCANFETGPNGAVVAGRKHSYALGDSITLSCSNGTQLQPPIERITCLGYTWSEPAVPICVPAQEEPKIQQHEQRARRARTG